MSRDNGQTVFNSIDDVIAHFKAIYPVQPEVVLKQVVEFCMENPTKFPDNYKDIDLSKKFVPKKEKEITIDGAVEFFKDPNDPTLRIIKHREGATVLTQEEAEELQIRIDEAIVLQEMAKSIQPKKKYSKNPK